MTKSLSRSVSAVHATVARERCALVSAFNIAGGVSALLARQHALANAVIDRHVSTALASGGVSALLARQHALANAVIDRHASTALASGGVSALLARQRSHVSALHELVNRQRSHVPAALASGGVSALLARQHALANAVIDRHASTALASGGVSALLARQHALATAATDRHVSTALASGGVSALLARQRSHVSALHELVNRQRSHVPAALASGGVSALLARQHALANAVIDRHASTALASGGVSALLARQHALANAVTAVIRPFVSTESVPIVTPHDDNSEDVSHLQRFDLVAEIDAFLEQTLGMLNPAFRRQFRGSMQRSEERGPDWWTQAAASERKLFLGVLHTAAPDKLVLSWVTNPKEQLDRLGHPTRRTKIAWLCRSIPNESYRKFLIVELDSALALIDLLNTAVHVDDFPEFEESFSWTQLRLKVAIRHILKVWLK